MNNDTLKLTDDQVLVHARDLLGEHLPLTAEGTCCTTEELVNALLGVAVNRSTLEAVCTDWLTAPDPETVRHYLNEQLCVEALPELERRLNAALRAEIPRRIWRQAREVAIDFHDRPYYGKQPQEDGLWVRGQARDGPTPSSGSTSATALEPCAARVSSRTSAAMTCTCCSPLAR